jgi:hypothetical protein
VKNLFVAVLLAGSLSMFGAAYAADGCGPGCHATWEGECVIDGWTRGAAPNECPVTTRLRPPCRPGYVWRSGGTGGCYQK